MKCMNCGQENKDTAKAFGRNLFSHCFYSSVWTTTSQCNENNDLFFL